mmetsp:Transcript_5590/g.12423  ORF Transcript_5590/g.12423 Transcript_5590/m.12423 type:complete len:93 (+) Transcript_5590:52-330(+)
MGLSSTQLSEFYCFEFQGRICVDSKLSSALTTSIREQSSKVRMNIGRHDVRGKRQALNKPMLLIARAKGQKYHPLGVVRGKFIFTERPQITE